MILHSYIAVNVVIQYAFGWNVCEPCEDGRCHFNHSELKYASSRPMDRIGFERLEKSEMTPRLTRVLPIRPSHISETCYVDIYLSVKRQNAEMLLTDRIS